MAGGSAGGNPGRVGIGWHPSAVDVVALAALFSNLDAHAQRAGLHNQIPIPAYHTWRLSPARALRLLKLFRAPALGSSEVCS